MIKKVNFIFFIISKAPERLMRLQENVLVKSYKVAVLYKKSIGQKLLRKMCSQIESVELFSFYILHQTLESSLNGYLIIVILLQGERYVMPYTSSTMTQFFTKFAST